jgi:hypothetical protein
MDGNCYNMGKTDRIYSIEEGREIYCIMSL